MNETNPPSTPLLDAIAHPHDVAQLPRAQLPVLAQELRDEILDIVSETGGHLGASLGVIELTIALHYVYNSPHDRIIWDVGHQCYAHKLLTGRRELMRNLRKQGGASGFPLMRESPHDAFGTAHSSTSLSAAIGMAEAMKLRGEDTRHVIAVIGDGAMSAGMAYEALNNASNVNLKVVLNDNAMSISPPTGAMNDYLRALQRLAGGGAVQVGLKHGKAIGKKAKEVLPAPIGALAKSVGSQFAQAIANRIDHSTWFEALGVEYHGPVDGHNIGVLIECLQAMRDGKTGEGTTGHSPQLLHALTMKGKGYAPAEQAPDRLHAVAALDKVGVGTQPAPTNQASFSSVLGGYLCEAATTHPNLVVVTPAMLSGSGLNGFHRQFPNRCYDVGIAEQHAVTFAAGLACEGILPMMCIYSTFLQRAYDQVVHDVALQHLPVRFIVDRAGYVGADGATHAGCYDLSMVTPLEGALVCSASDGKTLATLLKAVLLWDSGPSFLRFARGTTVPCDDFTAIPAAEVGKAEVRIEGESVAIFALGSRVGAALAAAESVLQQHGWSPTVVDARFVKPHDQDLVGELLKSHRAIVIVEDATGAGLAHQIRQATPVAQHGQLRSLQMPESYIHHAATEEQYRQAGLDAEAIAAEVLNCR